MSDRPPRLDAGGVPCHVLIDGWRTVSPRFVFAGYADEVQGAFVRAYLDADGKLPGRSSGLLIAGTDGPVLVDARNRGRAIAQAYSTLQLIESFYESASDAANAQNARIS